MVFAMRAGDDQRTFAANEKFLQQFRQRTITQFVIEHIFRFGIAARNGVADHHQVRFVSQVLLRIAGHHFDLSFGQKCRHGRVNVLVGTGDRKPFSCIAAAAEAMAVPQIPTK